MFRLATVTMLTIAISACSNAPKVETPAAAPVVAAAPAAPAPAPAPTPAAPQAAPESKVATVDLAAQARAATPSHLDPASPLARERSIYFDFDQFVIRSQDRPVVESHGKYLAAGRTLKVAVEGHADERGSREYNLALGQKRAQAVVQALKLLGANDEQLEAVSYGEERPKASGSDESAWAQNRRADIRYK
ncbi:MAG: peptidoglycan-associated lipoprotein Pal [Burkholderiaceae bacterium]|nr:peptidoglycan-associated lipoprotein Pal [Burkholderiaceae bacterium]